MSAPGSLAKRTAIVTGASSGIGAATARMLLEAGARVIALAPDEELLRAALGGPQDDRLLLVPLDLNRASDILPTIEALPSAFDQIDTVINCAGHDRGGRRPFVETAPEDIISVISVNLTASLLVIRAALPRMIASGRGDIVNVGSNASRRSYPTIATYSASKHGVRGFTEVLRDELEQTPLRVTEIVPGAVRTRFAAERFADDQKGDSYYSSRPGSLKAEDVAAAILWTLEQPAAVSIGELMILPTNVKSLNPGDVH